MTIINPNSISGISSITALNSTAAINLFKADGTSANIIAGVTTGSNFITGTSNVHSTGYECTNINASGIVTAASLDISGDIDFDGHTNLDNVSIAGVTTFTGAIDANSALEVAGIANFDSTLQVAEKIEHLGDTDTYLQFTANTINLHSGGTTGLTVLDTSVRVPTKLGINGAAPQVPLDIIANGSGYAINVRGRSSDNVGEIRFTSNNYGTLYSVLQTGATYLKISTGGQERLELDVNETTFNNLGADTDFRIRTPAQTHMFYVNAGTNQVSIKTSSPASGAELTVNGRTHTDTQFTIGSNSTLDAGVQATIYKPATNTLAFATAGANERLRIDNNGRVLINTTSNTNAHTQSDDLVVGNTSHGHDTGITIVSNPSYSGWLAFSDGTSADEQRKAGLVYQHSSDTLYLRNNGNQNRLIIDSSGNVGINRTSPAALLHVSKSYTAPTGGIDGNTCLLLSNSGGSAYAGLAIQGTTSGGSYIHFGDTDDINVGNILYDHPTNSMQLITNANERLRITSSGTINIGGTYTGTTHKLQVDNGTTHFKGRVFIRGTMSFNSTPFGANVTYDTGISVNAGGYGGSILAICSKNYGSGTNTQSGVYLIKFHYDGNNTPSITLIAGSNLATFAQSASNTLTVAMGASNNMFTAIESSVVPTT